jgi:phosphoserine phosphatase
MGEARMSDKVVLRFSFHAKRDEDILAWLAERPNRSLAVRQALRAWISRADRLDADVLRQVLREELSRVSVQGTGSAAVEMPQEDEEVTEALDSLMGAWAELGGDDN